MKKSFAAVAVILAAGLTVTAAGCGSSSKNLAILSSNWYTGTTFKGFQPEVCEGTEKIVYSVKQEPMEEAYANETYSVEYADGTYTTEFFAATFNFADFAYPESYKKAYENEGKFTAYCYTTKLEIPLVTYTLKSDGANPQKFENQTVSTVSWFLSVGEYLRPLYSKQDVNSVTPWSLKPKKLEEGDAFKSFNLTYENFYSFDGKTVTTKMTDNGAQNAQPQESGAEKLNKSKYSLFDPFAQDIVVRASDLYSRQNLSQPISVYIPKSGKIENFTLQGYDSAVKFADDAQKNHVIDELAKVGLYEEQTPAQSDATEGENAAKDRKLDTVAVTVTYTSGSQPGATQTYWFASVADKHQNVSRATMIKLSTPLSYYLGTLVYTLDKIETNF